MNKKWSQEEIEFIKNNAPIYSDDRLTLELGNHFNKAYSKGAVRKCRQRLKIKKAGYRGHFAIVDNTINTNNLSNLNYITTNNGSYQNTGTPQ